MGLILKIAVGVILAVVVLAYITTIEGIDGTGTPTAGEQFVEEPEPEYAATWEWVDAAECSEGTRCWQITVSSDSGCPNGLYGELNILDTNGTVIDYTNDTLGRLGAGGSAILTFDYYGDGAESGEIAKLECS